MPPPAVPRLGIPAYNWWNEALHGVACTKEKVTVFPQAIGMAATFDTEALQKMGDMTSSEGRALFNEDLKAGKTGGNLSWTDLLTRISISSVIPAGDVDRKPMARTRT